MNWGRPVESTLARIIYTSKHQRLDSIADQIR